MPSPKKIEQQAAEDDQRLSQVIKRELMKWYFEAMYKGDLKPAARRKNSLSPAAKKCKDI